VLYVDRNTFRAVSLLKIRSGTAASPTNQGADRIIGFVVRSELW